MSLFGAINTAVSGLTAQSTAFGNISEDVANSQTVGFKRVDTKPTGTVNGLTTYNPQQFYWATAVPVVGVAGRLAARVTLEVETGLKVCWLIWIGTRAFWSAILVVELTSHPFRYCPAPLTRKPPAFIEKSPARVFELDASPGSHLHDGASEGAVQPVGRSDRGA
jgi:hypothetical protein